MTTSHIFYIPLVLLAGLVLGVLLGRRSLAAADDEEQRREERRVARRAKIAAVEGKTRDAETSGSSGGEESAE